MNKFVRIPFVLLIIFYQKFLSFDQGLIPKLLGIQKKVCIYYPTCSEYMKQSIQKYGVFKGIKLGGSRLLRCNPKNQGGVDLVP